MSVSSTGPMPRRTWVHLRHHFGKGDTSKKPERKAGKRGPGRPKGSKTKRGPGRPRKVTAGSESERIRELLGSGKCPSDIAEQVGCSVNLVYAVRGRTGASGTWDTRQDEERTWAAEEGCSARTWATAAGVDPARQPSIDGPMAAVQDLVSNLEEHARENARMRETLEAIGRMIDRVR